ncbi:MAG: HEPN domain-containing protein [Patescibacteria group bacterium]|nr:HEPN domain-containing protein [Patescibacteria group bacterium]
MTGASAKFQECIKKGKLKTFSRGRDLADKEIRLAKEDLDSSKNSFGEENFRWSVVQAYYSMFHSARGLLYNKNYREHSHYCLIEAIRDLYVATGDLSNLSLEALIKAKQLREAADYYGDFSEINAKRLLKSAEEFMEESEKIVKKEKDCPKI